MAKSTLDSLEYRHKVKPIAKRGAPVQTKSTEMKTFDSPIDMTGDVMGKRATSKMAKATWIDNPKFSQGGWFVDDNGKYLSEEVAGPRPAGATKPIKHNFGPNEDNLRGGPPALPQPSTPVAFKPSAPVAPRASTPTASKPSVPNFTPRSIKPTSSRIKDVPMPKKPAATSKVAKATRNEIHPLQSDNNPVGRGGNGGRGPQFSPYRSYTKDITAAGFVPSIGVGSGKKKDLQAPAKNLTPPSGAMRKDIGAGFVPSIGVGGGKKKNDGMPSTFIIDHKKKK